MNAIAPQTVRRDENDARGATDRLLSGAIAVAVVLLVLALAASIAGAFAHARDDAATDAAFAATAKVEALARTIARDPANGRGIDRRDAEALAAALDDPALRLASQTTRTDVRDTSVRALAIVVAFAIVAIGGSIRVRRTRATADRFTAMLERVLADMARSTIDLREAKRVEVVREKARGRFVMNVDFRYVVTKPFSEELGEIFEIGDLEGYPFGTLLRRIAPTHDRAALAAFAERLFDPTYPDAMLASHRLHEVRHGARTLSFAFERIWDREEIESIVVAVSDITPAEPSPPELPPADDRELRQAAYDRFVAATPPAELDALATEIAAYAGVLGRTLGAKEPIRQLGTLHEATTNFVRRLVTLDFSYLATRVERFDARTVESLARPRASEGNDLSYALAIAELTSDLEALRAAIPREKSPRKPMR